MNTDATRRRPPGRCVLVVEDEMHLAMMLEDILADAGCRVLKAARLPSALELAVAQPIDGAILDINLAGAQVFPVAEVLRERGIPFLFTSGYGEDGLPDAYRDCAMLQKPYVVANLQHALSELLGDPVCPDHRAARP